MIDLDECSFDIPGSLFGRMMFFVHEFVTFSVIHITRKCKKQNQTNKKQKLNKTFLD